MESKKRIVSRFTKWKDPSGSMVPWIHLENVPARTSWVYNTSQEKALFITRTSKYIIHCLQQRNVYGCGVFTRWNTLLEKKNLHLLKIMLYFTFTQDHMLYFSVVRTYWSKQGPRLKQLISRSSKCPHYARNKAVGTMKVEPMINEGVWQDERWPDNWTADGKRSAQYEDTMLVTDDGVQVLTAK